MQRILAIGGGGFQMEDPASPIHGYILRLTGKSRPRICFLPTPSGDLPEHIEMFYQAFGRDCCEPSHLAFFRDSVPGAVPLTGFEDHLLSQDVVFVGVGNTQSALAVWRGWALDHALARAYGQGVLMTGVSAGAMCWFQFGLTGSYWRPGYRPLPCLGLLPGGCGVHYNSDPKRRDRFHAAIEASAVPPSVAIDDYAAVLYQIDAEPRVVAWREGSTAYEVSLVANRAHEVPYVAEFLAAPTSVAKRPQVTP